METCLDRTEYNTYVKQYPEVGYWIIRGILNFEFWHPSWILRKNIHFRPQILPFDSQPRTRASPQIEGSDVLVRLASPGYEVVRPLVLAIKSPKS
jgi:hypothetical protein